MEIVNCNNEFSVYIYSSTRAYCVLGPVQTSHFCRVEFNANEQKPLFELICIEFDAAEMRRLNWALG